jgi:hypothetical protein
MVAGKNGGGQKWWRSYSSQQITWYLFHREHFNLIHLIAPQNQVNFANFN